MFPRVTILRHNVGMAGKIWTSGSSSTSVPFGVTGCQGDALGAIEMDHWLNGSMTGCG